MHFGIPETMGGDFIMTTKDINEVSGRFIIFDSIYYMPPKK